MGHGLAGNVECTILEGKQRLLQEDFSMQIEKDLRICKQKKKLNNEEFTKNRKKSRCKANYFIL